MYGPGQPPQQYGPQQGQVYGPGHPYGPHAQAAPPFQPQPPYAQAAQPYQAPGGAPAKPRAGLPVLAAVVVLAVTGAVNAAWAPISFLHEQYRSLWLVGGDPLFLATSQALTGAACLIFGVLLLTRQGFAWGGALVSILAFGTFEAYCITRGVAEHFVGLFLVVVAVALLNQTAVRRFCGIGPPSQ
ncbi:MAG: hypothetical protein ACRDMV_09725 [Streptosporangiales bacterium]